MDTDTGPIFAREPLVGNHYLSLFQVPENTAAV